MAELILGQQKMVYLHLHLCFLTTTLGHLRKMSIHPQREQMLQSQKAGGPLMPLHLRVDVRGVEKEKEKEIENCVINQYTLKSEDALAPYRI